MSATLDQILKLLSKLPTDENMELLEEVYQNCTSEEQEEFIRTHEAD